MALFLVTGFPTHWYSLSVVSPCEYRSRCCDLVRSLMSNFALEILAVDLNALGFDFKANM